MVRLKSYLLYHWYTVNQESFTTPWKVDLQPLQSLI